MKHPLSKMGDGRGGQIEVIHEPHVSFNVAKLKDKEGVGDPQMKYPKEYSPMSSHLNLMFPSPLLYVCINNILCIIMHNVTLTALFFFFFLIII